MKSTRLIRWLFLRGLGITYWIAFRSLKKQVIGLYGERGILPISEFLKQLKQARFQKLYRTFPTLLWLDASDATLLKLCDYGTWASAALILGITPRLTSAVLGALYLSFVSVGQDFLSFQWDALLIESSLHAVFTGRSDNQPPGISVILMRWLSFRLYFESGLCKYQSHDPSWNKNASACSHHYQTQPLPSPLGWYAHQLPATVHRFSTKTALAIEQIVPLFIFSPTVFRRLAFAVLSTFQILIELTGNYGFFNLLTIVNSLWILDDELFHRAQSIFPIKSQKNKRQWPENLAAIPVLILSWNQIKKSFSGKAISSLERSVAPFRLVNRYGLFSFMTTSRQEIVLEGSENGYDWREYEFFYKVGNPKLPPRWAAPYHPRLDWQMWFAAMETPPPWFQSLIVKLLEGVPEVLALLAENPFPNHPPRYIRAVYYEYKMTDIKTRKLSGAWWQRERIGLYFPPAELNRTEIA